MNFYEGRSGYKTANNKTAKAKQRTYIAANLQNSKSTKQQIYKTAPITKKRIYKKANLQNSESIKQRLLQNSEIADLDQSWIRVYFTDQKKTGSDNKKIPDPDPFFRNKSQ